MSNIRNIITKKTKTLKFWSYPKFIEIIKVCEDLYYKTTDNREKYNKVITILKKSKNNTNNVKENIKYIWGDESISNDTYREIWREFVDTFEKSDRTLIVKDIDNAIKEKAPSALSISKNSEKSLKIDNERLKRENKRLTDENKRVKHENIRLKKMNEDMLQLNSID